ncbi:MAG: threonine/serine exporter family protein [Oscillospiraceae bacterium]|nr:threonine/serine exporter family protein [Oscillospiraceae bacterium]
MNFSDVFLGFIYNFFACLFFALLLHTPKRSMFWASFLGAAGYVVYLFTQRYINIAAGFFFGTLLMSIGAEILSRHKKMPVTVFITPAIISLVPGTGLYQSMVYFVSNDTANGVNVAVETIINAGAMAIAIACTGVLFRMKTNTHKFHIK